MVGSDFYKKIDKPAISVILLILLTIIDLLILSVFWKDLLSNERAEDLMMLTSLVVNVVYAWFIYSQFRNSKKQYALMDKQFRSGSMPILIPEIVGVNTDPNDLMLVISLRNNTEYVALDCNILLNFFVLLMILLMQMIQKSIRLV